MVRLTYSTAEKSLAFHLDKVLRKGQDIISSVANSWNCPVIAERKFPKDKTSQEAQADVVGGVQYLSPELRSAFEEIDIGLNNSVVDHEEGVSPESEIGGSVCENHRRTPSLKKERTSGLKKHKQTANDFMHSAYGIGSLYCPGIVCCLKIIMTFGLMTSTVGGNHVGSTTISLKGENGCSIYQDANYECHGLQDRIFGSKTSVVEKRQLLKCNDSKDHDVFVEWGKLAILPFDNSFSCSDNRYMWYFTHVNGREVPISHGQHMNFMKGEIYSVGILCQLCFAVSDTTLGRYRLKDDHQFVVIVDISIMAAAPMKSETPSVLANWFLTTISIVSVYFICLLLQADESLKALARF